MCCSSVGPGSAAALHRTQCFAAKLDLCLHVATHQPRNHRGGPLRNTFILSRHNALLIAQLSPTPMVCLVEIGSRGVRACCSRESRRKLMFSDRVFSYRPAP